MNADASWQGDWDGDWQEDWQGDWQGDWQRKWKTDWQTSWYQPSSSGGSSWQKREEEMKPQKCAVMTI